MHVISGRSSKMPKKDDDVRTAHQESSISTHTQRRHPIVETTTGWCWSLPPSSMMYQPLLRTCGEVSWRGGAAARWTSSFLSRPILVGNRGMISTVQEQQQGLVGVSTGNSTSSRRWMGDDSSGSSERLHSTE